jgi:serine/threonine-protein kinase
MKGSFSDVKDPFSRMSGAGHSLRRLIEGGPLPLERAVRIVRQACEGVAAAHAMGILHRDLSPGNVLRLTRGAR